MNQVKPKTDFRGFASRRGLTEADAQNLHKELVKGDQALARQKDIIEMHKRIVAMFTTLNTGLREQQSKKATEDRAVLVRKLEKMELAVNGMEAVMRIEMAPQLERMLNDALDRRMPKKKPRRFRMLGAIVTVCIGLAIGSVYSEEIKEMSSLAVAQTGLNIVPE